MQRLACKLRQEIRFVRRPRSWNYLLHSRSGRATRLYSAQAGNNSGSSSGASSGRFAQWLAGFKRHLDLPFTPILFLLGWISSEVVAIMNLKHLYGQEQIQFEVKRHKLLDLIDRAEKGEEVDINELSADDSVDRDLESIMEQLKEEQNLNFVTVQDEDIAFVSDKETVTPQTTKPHDSKSQQDRPKDPIAKPPPKFL